MARVRGRVYPEEAKTQRKRELEGYPCSPRGVSKDEAGEAGKARAGEPTIKFLALI